jgi:hypothetical protein
LREIIVQNSDEPLKQLEIAQQTDKILEDAIDSIEQRNVLTEIENKNNGEKADLSTRKSLYSPIKNRESFIDRKIK